MAEMIEIPEYSDRDVGFAGVEVNKVWPFGLSLLVGILLNGQAWWWTLVLPYGGYRFNKIYIEWIKTKQRDFIRAKLYSWGLLRYSNIFTSADQIYIGDANIGLSRSARDIKS
jgi:hypothetical protein